MPSITYSSPPSTSSYPHKHSHSHAQSTASFSDSDSAPSASTSTSASRRSSSELDTPSHSEHDDDDDDDDDERGHRAYTHGRRDTPADVLGKMRSRLGRATSPSSVPVSKGEGHAGEGMAEPVIVVTTADGDLFLPSISPPLSTAYTPSPPILEQPVPMRKKGGMKRPSIVIPSSTSNSNSTSASSSSAAKPRPKVSFGATRTAIIERTSSSYASTSTSPSIWSPSWSSFDSPASPTSTSASPTSRLRSPTSPAPLFSPSTTPAPSPITPASGSGSFSRAERFKRRTPRVSGSAARASRLSSLEEELAVADDEADGEFGFGAGDDAEVEAYGEDEVWAAEGGDDWGREKGSEDEDEDREREMEMQREMQKEKARERDVRPSVKYPKTNTFFNPSSAPGSAPSPSSPSSSSATSASGPTFFTPSLPYAHSTSHGRAPSPKGIGMEGEGEGFSDDEVDPYADPIVDADVDIDLDPLVAGLSSTDLSGSGSGSASEGDSSSATVVGARVEDKKEKGSDLKRDNSLKWRNRKGNGVVTLNLMQHELGRLY